MLSKSSKNTCLGHVKEEITSCLDTMVFCLLHILLHYFCVILVLNIKVRTQVWFWAKVRVYVEFNIFFAFLWLLWFLIFSQKPASKCTQIQPGWDKWPIGLYECDEQEFITGQGIFMPHAQSSGSAVTLTRINHLLKVIECHVHTGKCVNILTCRPLKSAEKKNTTMVNYRAAFVLQVLLSLFNFV